MATLKDIKGTNIQVVDTDPVEYVGTWSSGGTLNTARKDLGSFGAGATNGIAAGGYGGGGAAAGNYVESYNGTSWTETTELNAGRGWSPAGAGTQTAGFVAGGQPLPPASGYTGITEKWDGSSWSESGDLNIARAYMNAAGTQTAGIGFGGNNPSPTASRTDTEKFNGTAWTEANNMNTARDENSLSSRGSPQSSVISVFNSSTEVYDGTNWTETTEVNTARDQGGGAGESSTSAVIYGGKEPSVSTKTETWDGTAWTEGNDLSAARADGGTTGGTSQNALYAGGEPPSYTGATEEWAFPPAPVSNLTEGLMWFNSSTVQLKGYGQSVPTGTWATGNNLNTSRQEGSTSGVQTASIVGGGYTTTYVANTEIYDGSSWTEVNDMNAAKGGMAPSVKGSTTATFAAGGAPNPSPPTTNNVEFWNTNTWTEGTNMNTARTNAAGAGTQTSGLVYMGYYPTYQTNTETWDGTSWTEVNDLNNAGYGSACIGTQTAALATGRAGNPTKSKAEDWNGTSWTNLTDQNTGRFGTGGAGTSTQGLMFAGNENPGASAKTELWNGTSWTELNDLGSGSPAYQAGCGAAGLALRTNGDPTPSNFVEEWTAADGVLTITTS